MFIFKLLYGPVCPLTHPDMDNPSTNCPHINKLTVNKYENTGRSKSNLRDN
jgi:hypothetical protein